LSANRGDGIGNESENFGVEGRHAGVERNQRNIVGS